MEKIKIYYNKETDTMDICFGSSKEEYICEEAGEGIILKKNKDNKVIGIEKLYVSKMIEQDEPLSLEVIV